MVARKNKDAFKKRRPFARKICIPKNIPSCIACLQRLQADILRIGAHFSESPENFRDSPSKTSLRLKLDQRSQIIARIEALLPSFRRDNPNKVAEVERLVHEIKHQSLQGAE